MKKRIPLLILLVLLGYIFWISPDFATLAAGVSIFLFGMALLEMGFTSFAGGTMEKYLRKSTDTLGKSLLWEFSRSRADSTAPQLETTRSAVCSWRRWRTAMLSCVVRMASDHSVALTGVWAVTVFSEGEAGAWGAADATGLGDGGFVSRGET